MQKKNFSMVNHRNLGRAVEKSEVGRRGEAVGEPVGEQSMLRSPV